MEGVLCMKMLLCKTCRLKFCLGLSDENTN